MSNEHKENILKWGIVFLTAMFSIFLLYLNIKMPFVLGDDFLYALKFPSEGFIGSARIENIGDYFESQINHYNNYNNRILPHALLQFILLCPTYLFDFINVIVFLILPYVIIKPILEVSIKKHLTTNISKVTILYFLVLLYLWCFHYDLGRSYFWTTGSINYSWFLVFQLMYVGQLYKSTFGTYRLGKASILLSLLICTSNENVVLSLFVLSICLICYKKAIEKVSVENAIFVSTIILLFGGVLMLCSPAIGMRIENETLEFDSFYYRGLEFFKRQAFYILCGLSAFILMISYKAKRLQRSKIIFFGILMAVSSAVMFMAPLYEPRSSIFAFIIFLMLVLSCLDLSSTQNMRLFYFLFILSLLFVPERIGDVCKARLNYNKSMQTAISTQADSKVVFNNFCEDYQMSIAVCDELSADENKFENKVLAAYLEKENVIYQNKIKTRLQERFLLNYRELITNQDSFRYVSIDQKLSDQFNLKGIYKNEREWVFDVESFSDDSFTDNVGYVLRGVRKTNLRHRLIGFLPSFLSKYFLSFLEKDATIQDENSILFYNVLEPENYDSFIFALYDKQNHTTFGNHVVVKH